MGLMLAPYNNAMRLGQGFNSYTQEICIDDAVIVDPGRPENSLTNDGTTMADLRLMMQGSEAYSSIKKALMGGDSDDIPITGHLDDDEEEAGKESKTAKDGKNTKGGSKEDGTTRAAEDDEKLQTPDGSTAAEETSEASGAEEAEEGAAGGNHGDRKGHDGKKGKAKREDPEAAKAGGDNDLKDDHKEDGNKEDGKLDDEENAFQERDAKEKAADEQKKKNQKAKDEEDEKARAAKRAKAEREEEERTEAAKARAKHAATAIPYTKAERDAWLGKEAARAKSAGDEAASGKKTRQYTFKPTGARGHSQIVTYSSRFIDKLSDITHDMNISGALSIKYGVIGGSGRGGFVNSDKFHESDLNFYISVKVINQTTNLKDALVYQPLSSVNHQNFREVYGDSFISGFLEGGEFNAIVSMKVLNKSQMSMIKAEAKVALTVGVGEAGAEGAVDIAKQNLINNTETTVQVSWSGGGFIKPIDEPWGIESLMSAAARFPDLVAITPQRTYAILTKYESLRSFVKLKPARYSEMKYESAQLYTYMLMDTYMDYKSILKKLSSDIFDIEKGASVIEENSKGKASLAQVTSNDDPKNVFDKTPFDASLAGLDRAKRACRFQMVRIVNEVDKITEDATIATDESRVEPFQTPRTFKDRLPLVQPVVAAPIVPLSNRKIEPGSEKNYGPLCSDMHELEKPERHAIKELLRERPDLARYFRLTKPVGSSTEGMQFNTLDFLKHSVTISSVKVGVTDGVVTSIQMQYSNGLQCIHGGTPPNTSIISLDELDERERIIACSIETGREVKPSSPSGKGEGTKTAKSTHGTADPPSDAVELEPRILGMKLFTNRGRSLVAESKVFEDSTSQKIQERGSRKFTDVRMTEFDPVMDNAWIKGFWGYSRNGSRGDEKDGLWRVGVIWGNNLKPEFVPDTEEKDASEGKDKDVSRVKGDKDKKKDKGSKKKEKQDGGR